MRWYIEKHVNDGILRHPADSQEWKEFDLKHSEFALEPRNVRLGMATNGFNPFGNMNNNYSMWLVILIPYNLPPWLVMKEPYLMMSLLIPGSNQPGNELDVFLRSLVDKLKELWEEGARTYDAFVVCIFRCVPLCCGQYMTILNSVMCLGGGQRVIMLVTLAMMNHIRRHWKVKLDTLTIKPTCLWTTLGEGVAH